LSYRNQLWGKARSYLETSLAMRPAAETFEALGQLMERIGDKEAAAKAYQRGLTMRTIGDAGVSGLLPARGAQPRTGTD
jgi:HemY protein